jgi:hypothetical protein
MLPPWTYCTVVRSWSKSWGSARPGQQSPLGAAASRLSDPFFAGPDEIQGLPGQTLGLLHAAGPQICLTLPDDAGREGTPAAHRAIPFHDLFEQRQGLGQPPRERIRVAGNLVRKYTLSHRCLFFKRIEHDYGYCSRPHSSGLVLTTQTAKPAYFLLIGANRSLENWSKYPSLRSDSTLSV